jgi:hypothetical protein
VKKATFQKQLTDFSVTVNYDLGKKFKLIEEIAQEHSKNQNSVPLGYIMDISEEHGFKFVTVSINNDVLYSLIFPDSPTKENFTYNFMAKYEWPELRYYVENDDFVQDIAVENKETEFKISFSFPTFFPSVFAQEDEFVYDDSDLWNDQYYVQSLNDVDLVTSVVDDPTLLDNPIVYSAFEDRLNNVEFVGELNGNRAALNSWAQTKGINFGESGQLASFQNGMVTTKGAEWQEFDPFAVPEGTLVLESGKLKYPNGVVVGGGLIEKEDKVQGGFVELDGSKDVKNLELEKGTVYSGDFKATQESGSVKMDVDNEGVVTLKEAENLELVYENGRPVKNLAVDGEESVAQGENTLKVTGDVTLHDDHVTLKENSFLSDEIEEGVTSTSYFVSEDTEYYWEEGKCSSRNCISRDFSTGSLEVDVEDNRVVIESFDDSIEKMKVIPTKKGKVEYNYNNIVKLQFSEDPLLLRGDASSMVTEIETKYKVRNREYDVRLTPSEKGFSHSVCYGKRCRYTGTLTSDNTLFMNQLRNSKKNQNEWAEEFGERYGNRNSLRIMGFLDDPSELRLVNAIHTSAENLDLDKNFLTAVSFTEGLGLWISDYYRQNPHAEVNSFLNLGMDRFGKEEKRLKEGGYLREDFGGRDYKVIGTIEGETGEKSPSINFRNINTAMEGFAAMVKVRQDLVVKDLESNGLDKSSLTRDELNYWTYVYYNAGSGPPEDKFGKGRNILLRRVREYKEGDSGAFSIPSEQMGKKETNYLGKETFVQSSALGNSQRVISTAKLLDRATEGQELPDSSYLALVESDEVTSSSTQ